MCCEAVGLDHTFCVFPTLSNFTSAVYVVLNYIFKLNVCVHGLMQHVTLSTRSVEHQVLHRKFIIQFTVPDNYIKCTSQYSKIRMWVKRPNKVRVRNFTFRNHLRLLIFTIS